MRGRVYDTASLPPPLRTLKSARSLTCPHAWPHHISLACFTRSSFIYGW